MWLYQEWQERRMLSRVAENAANLYQLEDTMKSINSMEPSISESYEQDKKEMASMKVFNELFSSSIIRGYLYRQSLETFDTESVEFCSAVIEFRHDPTLTRAQTIMDTFIFNNGDKCVNISSSVRSKTEQRFEELLNQNGHKTIEAQKEADREERKDDAEAHRFIIYTNKVKPVFHKTTAEFDKKLLKLFDAAFMETRRLVYLNNWRPFRESDYGVAAAAWFEWLEYMTDYSLEEKTWVAEDILRRIRADQKTSKFENKGDTNIGERARTGFMRASQANLGSRHSSKSSRIPGVDSRSMRQTNSKREPQSFRGLSSMSDRQSQPSMASQAVLAGQFARAVKAVESSGSEKV
uniref:RGS domain-containing protein n=2 Tax=Lotharella globosa TaxID=91324 RepID=A0A7S4DNQ5_9EUKA